MNQIQFETSKVFGVFVKDITPEFTDLHPQYSHYLNQGFVSNLTDEQKEGVCEETDNPYWYGQGMKWIDYTDDSNCFVLVSLAFASLLTSLNVLLVNPYGGIPEFDYAFAPDGPTDSQLVSAQNDYADRFENWQTAQQNVGQWILLTFDK